MISSRFHALVAAMPAGVPSIGIAMDEPIRNLFTEANQGGRLIATDNPDLGIHVVEAARRLDRDEVRCASRATTEAAVRAIGGMGRQFLDEFRLFFPDFALPAHRPAWQAHLPTLPADIDSFLSH
jgi:polysaccharide pyruvyl transferase WcaK-like protein